VVEGCIGCHDSGDDNLANASFRNIPTYDVEGTPTANPYYNPEHAGHAGAIGDCFTCHQTEGEPIHGQWSDTVEACARCHRTHTAAGDDLLIYASKDTLCLFCHGSDAGPAQTNVIDGLLRYNSASLRGGGFTNATMNTAESIPISAGDLWRFPVAADDGSDETPSTADDYAGAGSAATTSKHTLGISALIWGQGYQADDPGTPEVDESLLPNAGSGSTTLECVSCHDPHAFNKTYRMLKKQPVGSTIGGHGSPVFAMVTDQLEWAQWNPTSNILSYTIDDYTEAEYASPDVLDDAGNAEMVGAAVKYSQQIQTWCASCHTRYHAEKVGYGAPGSTALTYEVQMYDAAGDPIMDDNGTPGDDSDDFLVTETRTDEIFTFRHKTGDAMIDSNTSSSCGYDGADCHGTGQDANRLLSCLGCHVAHGTSATMTPYAQIPWPGEDAVTEDGMPGTSVDANLVIGSWAEGSRSSLLRLDNRAVCQNAYCHPKGKISYLEGYEQGSNGEWHTEGH
jgi:predicted CXXCH cytochrome family protein